MTLIATCHCGGTRFGQIGISTEEVAAKAAFAPVAVTEGVLRDRAVGLLR